MKRLSIFTTLFSIFLVIVLLSIGVSALYSITTFKNFIFEVEKDDLMEKTEILLTLLSVDDLDNSEVLERFTQAGSGQKTRITIIGADGVVKSDSMRDHETMDNHLNRPEVVANIEDYSLVVERYSDTVKEHMIYYSLPLRDEVGIKGFLRTAISVEALNQRVNSVTVTIVIISIILFILSLVICYMVSMNFSSFINSIKRVAGYFAKGEFNNILVEKGPRELSSLSRSINSMGLSLRDRISTIVKQKNRYKSMLESMVEPVIRVDLNLIIEEINPSAEEFFNVTHGGAVGKSLLDITGSRDLNDIVTGSINSSLDSENIVVFQSSHESHLQIHSSILFDGEGNKSGVLLVMNDLTEHVRLEEMRKEFVANVSHELRTPTTAIQGYIETLMNNDVNEDQFKKFMGVLYNHSNRLNSIIDDLLVLAGLEKSSDSFVFELFPVIDLISSVINVIHDKAEKKSITLKVDSSERHLVYAHPILSEQALTNLVTNAVKYGGEGSTVIIRTLQGRYGTTIEVEDNGCGIPLDHQEQIFERFYRVDRARSRDQGGTGLGLSIVKRVMNIHGGDAKLKSEEGKGSVFSLYFPGKYH